MRAAFYEGHETIRIGECAPVRPGNGHVQIKVSHCGICGTDLHVFHGKMDHRVTFVIEDQKHRDKTVERRRPTISPAP